MRREVKCGISSDLNFKFHAKQATTHLLAYNVCEAQLGSVFSGSVGNQLTR